MKLHSKLLGAAALITAFGTSGLAAPAAAAELPAVAGGQTVNAVSTSTLQAAGRQFVAYSSYGWTKGRLSWGRKFIKITGAVRDFPRNRSRSCVELQWRGSHNNHRTIACDTDRSRQFQRFSKRFSTNTTPRNAHVRVCSWFQGQKRCGAWN